MLPSNFAAAYDPFAAQKLAARDAERVATDAQVDSEAADAEAAANRETSSRTNALATMLAQQRRTPGGGIRMGGRGNRRMSANSVGGLSRANAQNMATKRRAAAQAGLTSRYAAEDYAANTAFLAKRRADSSAAWQRNIARGAITTYA